ncbi:MAG: sigma-70 family RNA polymerase sigma factor [Lentisphaerae bacterium]|nr:sigma-70 family RNA polymerase sigma factor [Lentisphaerota bacterium]
MAEIHADWSLVERVKAGDDSAFEALMARYKSPVLNFVYRMIGDAGEAEDIAQEVFVRAYQAMRLPRLRRQKAQFSTWLFQVARHAAIDCLRRRKRQPTESLTALEENGARLADSSRAADGEIALKEVGAQIALAVARLPEDQKTAFLLAEYQDQPSAEIAAIMQCSTKAVELRLYRARQFLRGQLAHLLS